MRPRRRAVFQLYRPANYPGVCLQSYEASRVTTSQRPEMIKDTHANATCSGERTMTTCRNEYECRKQSAYIIANHTPTESPRTLEKERQTCAQKMPKKVSLHQTSQAR